MAASKKTDEVIEENIITEEPEKMVKLRIPLGRNDEEGDVFISVNERTYQIKRGEWVEVPASVAAVYKDSERQRDRNYRYLQKIAKKA